MPSKPNQDLDKFQYWLINVNFISRRTASVYASRVRAMLKMTAQPITSQSLDDFLGSAWAERSRDAYYCAWNRFTAFASTQGLKIPSPTLRSETRLARREYFIPDKPLDCILELITTCGLHRKKLPLVKWKHFKRIPNQGQWEMQDPVEPAYYYSVPISIVTEIYEWGHPDQPIDGSPLVPVIVGSLEPMPFNPLKRLLAKRKRSR
jgi:hypothetical protein